jgi:hypothetical protein
VAQINRSQKSDRARPTVNRVPTMKRTQFAVFGLSIGSLIYGVGALVGAVRLVRAGWSPRALGALAWPLVISILFGAAALLVHRRTTGK